MLTLLPAAVAATGIALALLIARRASVLLERLQAKHPKIASSITTLADAVDDTKRLLFHRGGGRACSERSPTSDSTCSSCGAPSWRIHAHPVPGFAVVIMAYIIGALGGSLPLPASIGTIGGIAGMLILYGVAHNPAVAAVLLHQAIGLLVPLVGGSIAYAIIRRRLGPIGTNTSEGSG